MPQALDIDPNPVPEGQDMEVQYDGNRSLHYSVDGGPWQEFPLDADGKGSLSAPTGASVVVFADLEAESGANEIVTVISLKT